MCGHAYAITLTFFWMMQILCFDQKIENNLKNFYNGSTHHQESNPQPLYHPAAGDTIALPVCCLLDIFRICVIYRGD